VAIFNLGIFNAAISNVVMLAVSVHIESFSIGGNLWELFIAKVNLSRRPWDSCESEIGSGAV
jgi:hypothetical protein